jgi:hypothetical protein
MRTTPLFALAVLPLCVLVLPAVAAHAQDPTLPKLGAPAPDFVLHSEKHNRVCDTGPGHKDPCAEIEVNKIRFTVAWNAQTREVTYLFTDDRHMVTDTQLSVGDTCRVIDPSGKADTVVPYMKWMIDPKWGGTDSNFDSTAVWYAALHKDDFDSHYGDVAGFVQSSYLQLKP